MALANQVVTAEELRRLPDDGFRHELVKGELRTMAPAGHLHGRITINLTTPLDRHVRAHHLGAVYAAETGFKLASNPDTVRAPDVAFIRRGRLEEVGDTDGYWPGAPDLAVEVISPSDTYVDVQEKVFDWLEAGTRMVVLVMPRQRAVTVYFSRTDVRLLTERDMLEGGDVVPGWNIPVRELFI